MKFRDIAKENPNHIEDQRFVLSWVNKNPHNLPDDKKKEFIQKWLKCEATLSEWVYAVNVNVGEILQNSKLSIKEKKKVLNRQKLLYDWYIEYGTLNILKFFDLIVKFTPFYALEFAENELKFFSDYIDKDISIKDCYRYRNFWCRIDQSVNMYEVVKIISAKGYKDTFNIHNPSGVNAVAIAFRYIRYLEAFISDNGNIEINDSLQTSEVNEFHFTKLFPELIKLSENIIIEYEYIGINGFTVINIVGKESSLDFKNYAVNIFLLGYERFVIKLKTIPNNDSISILSNLIDDFEEMKYIVEDREDSIEEYEDSPENTHNYKVFTNAKYKGNDDYSMAIIQSNQEGVLYVARYYAEAWLDSIDIMIRKFEYILNNLELIKLSKPTPTKSPSTIAEADNQTRAFYTHFRVQMGDISSDDVKNGIKFIKHGKYIIEADKHSYGEYRKIINDEVKDYRKIACCKTLIKLQDVKPAIISQAKAILPR